MAAVKFVELRGAAVPPRVDNALVRLLRFRYGKSNLMGPEFIPPASIATSTPNTDCVLYFSHDLHSVKSRAR